MTSTDTAEQILKTDVLGRVRSPRQRREQVLDEFERSGLSGAKFAELTGIKYTTFASWVQARRKKQGKYPKLSKSKVDPVRWVEALVPQAGIAPSPGAPLVIQLPCGARMEISGDAQAALAALVLKRMGEDQRPVC
jgi:hypothetical protein